MEELVCSRCQSTEEENGRLQQALISMEAEKTEQAFQIQAKAYTVGMLERELHKLKKAELEAAAPAPEENERTKEIRDILNHWKTATGAKGAKIDSQSDRWKLAHKMRNRYDRDILLDAISYVGLYPFQRYADRFATEAPNAKRRSKLEHCIGSDDRVDENSKGFRGVVVNAGKNLVWVEEVRREVAAEEALWGRLQADATDALRSGIVPGVPLVEFVRARWAAQARAWETEAA